MKNKVFGNGTMKMGIFAIGESLKMGVLLANLNTITNQANFNLKSFLMEISLMLIFITKQEG